MKTLNFVIVALALLLLQGCESTSRQYTKQDAYPLMYEENVRSILVVPAVNHTTAADAPALYATTVLPPLAEAGYYVMPVPVVEQLFQQQGITDGSQLRDIPVSRFQTLFGADAVLFVTIVRWDTSYYITGGNVSVGLDFTLVSTTTSQTIWSQARTLNVETSGNSNDLLVNIIATALNTALTKYIDLARDVNGGAIHQLPVGPYHPQHKLDGAEPVSPAGLEIDR